MTRAIGSLKRWSWVLAAIVPLAACDQGPSPEVQAELDQLQATRDSLNRELAERTETIQRLSSTIGEAMAGVSETGVTSPESLQDRISAMADNLSSTREQLADAQGRIRALSARATRLRDSLSAVITDRDEALAMQRDSIAELVSSVDSLSSRASMLADEHADAADALGTLEERYYTVYVAIGTRDELLERGIIEQEGGARVLLILWKAGETPVPARDLDPDQFEAIDLRQTSNIELPSPGSYRLVSRHNPEFVDASVDEEGRFQADSFRITEPAQFWQSSRYLILMRED